MLYVLQHAGLRGLLHVQMSLLVLDYVELILCDKDCFSLSDGSLRCSFHLPGVMDGAV